MAERGVCSAGFRMMLLPQAMAGRIFHTAEAVGPFQGMIPAQTPIGSRTEYTMRSSGEGWTVPSSFDGHPA